MIILFLQNGIMILFLSLKLKISLLMRISSEMTENLYACE